jgi:hypothetical protein
MCRLFSFSPCVSIVPSFDSVDRTRKHAELMFNWSVRRWELAVYGKAGVLVNTVPYSMGCPPVILDSRDLIEVPCDSCQNNGSDRSPKYCLFYRPISRGSSMSCNSYPSRFVEYHL